MSPTQILYLLCCFCIVSNTFAQQTNDTDAEPKFTIIFANDGGGTAVSSRLDIPIMTGCPNDTFRWSSDATNFNLIQMKDQFNYLQCDFSEGIGLISTGQPIIFTLLEEHVGTTLYFGSNTRLAMFDACSQINARFQIRVLAVCPLTVDPDTDDSSSTSLNALPLAVLALMLTLLL